MLDDGTCFHGQARGACQEAAGEVIFTTSMAGYQETLTDPSYYGQILVFTSAHVGNYGVSPRDDQSFRPQAAGAVFHELQITPAGDFPHWRAEGALDESMAAAGLTAISGIDTRALTMHIRDQGARNGIISAIDLKPESLLAKARALPSMQGLDLTPHVSCASQYYPAMPTGPELPQPILDVAVLDLGLKRSILDCFMAQGLRPQVWPAHTSAQTLLDSRPAGIFLSNGPGDPSACTHIIKTARQLLGRLPMLGICLGHQILALAMGGRTYKLPFGHHGVNHPVKNFLSQRVLITSQNHGFCVDPDSLGPEVTITHINLNDQTLEGLECLERQVVSLQFHPEASPGPYDARDTFKRFRGLITGETYA
jgi:carbamoyl-phosphate synthase small subunit